MALDTNLINAFAEQVTSAEDILDSGEYYNGTVKILDGKNYVQIDGSTTITPVAVSSVGLKDGNRVSCTIKDHRLSVIANMSDPSVNKTEVDEVKTKIIEVNTLIAEKVSTKDFEAKIADIEDLKADKATVEKLKADMLTADTADIRYAKIDDLKATDARIDNLKAGMVTAEDIAAKYATIENLKVTNETVTNLQGTYSTFEKTVTEELKAKQAAIDKLDADKLNANDADIKYATIKNLEATNADISNLSAKQATFESATAGNFTAVNANIETLRANKLDVDTANAKFANIDFANITEAAVKKIFSDSGIIKDLIVSEGKITGELVGVTIKGDLIEGGTVIADKLVVKGSNGLYYKLNTDGVTTEAEQTEYNSLNGSVITAKSITATKISVDDLVAFGATIAGYTIKDHALYSGTKSSATNGTRGVYMNDDGEFSVGDATNFIRFWKDTDGTYKLSISAQSITMSASGKSVESAINDAQNTANNAVTKAESAQTKADSTATELTEWKTSYTQDINGFKQTVEKTYATKSTVNQLQNIADAAIETWTGNGVPTLTTLPSSKWDTNDLKKQHSGDIYYDNDTGYAYRFGSSDGVVYSWSRIKDSDITIAIDKADTAQSTANTTQKNLDDYKNTVSNTYVTKTSFEQTAEGITSKVEAAQTTANSATTAASKAQQTADSVSVNLSKNYMTSSQVNSAIKGLQPAGDYATKTELKATSDSLTASVSSVKTIASNAQATADSASTKINSLKVGGRNLLLGTGVAKKIKGHGTTNDTATLYYLTASLYALDVAHNPMCESIEFMIDTEPASNSSVMFQYGRPYCGTFALSHNTTLTSDMVGKYVKLSSFDKHMNVAESKDANFIYIRLDNYTGNVIVRNAKLEYGTTATDWSPAPEDLATTNDVEEAKAYSAAQLKILSDNISTLVTDAAGKSMMTQTSSGWTFNMSKIQNGIDKNANKIDSVTGDLHNAEKTIDDINTNVKKLLDTSAYISIGQDDDGNPRLELGRKDSPFRVAISNTSIDFLEGTDKIAYISNKQLYIYSSVVTDELKIGDSTGYIWKRRANNHLGLRYVTS